MEKSKILTTKNIPEDILVGKGELTVLECKNEEIYRNMENDFRGSIFHLYSDGRWYIKVNSQVLKILKSYIEQ